MPLTHQDVSDAVLEGFDEAGELTQTATLSRAGQADVSVRFLVFPTTHHDSNVPISDVDADGYIEGKNVVERPRGGDRIATATETYHIETCADYDGKLYVLGLRRTEVRT